jgi:hypothetical protein
MQHGAPMVVKKGGFLAAAAYGFFGMLTAAIVCGTALGFYGLTVVDRRADQLVDLGSSVLTSLPELKQSLPPAVSDMLNDRRAPEYRDQVELDVRLAPDGGRRGGASVVIHATNNGDELITLMAVRVVLVNKDDVPVRSFATYAATPAMIDDDWRGPLMPNATRRCGMTLHLEHAGLTPKVEITDLRVWNGDPATSSGGPAVAAGIPIVPSIPIIPPTE